MRPLLCQNRWGSAALLDRVIWWPKLAPLGSPTQALVCEFVAAASPNLLLMLLYLAIRCSTALKASPPNDDLNQQMSSESPITRPKILANVFIFLACRNFSAYFSLSWRIGRPSWPRLGGLYEQSNLSYSWTQHDLRSVRLACFFFRLNSPWSWPSWLVSLLWLKPPHFQIRI